MYECVGAVGNAVAGPSGLHHAAVAGANGGGGSNSSAEENIYESVDEVRQRHLMGNIDVPGCSYVSGIYGRLDVIGHGIGRIERHLSSSCGSGIDNHYGCIVQPASSSSTSGTAHTFPSGYATLPSISSGSGSSHVRHAPSAVPLVPVVPVSPLALTGPSGGAVGGAALQTPPALSAVSVQWLLVNRWLPLWIATGHDNAASGHYYCNGASTSSSSASTYYHYQHQQQIDLPEYHCSPQHQQRQLQVPQVPLAAGTAAAAIQPSTSDTATNAANCVSGNTGTVARRGGASNAAAEGVQVGAASAEGNAGLSREGDGSPSPQQPAVQQQQQ